MAGGSTSSSALPFIRTQLTNVTDKVSPPVAGTCSSSASTFYVPAVPLQFPGTAVQQQKTSNGSQEDWLRHEQHEVLKRMLTERRRLNKVKIILAHQPSFFRLVPVLKLILWERVSQQHLELNAKNIKLEGQ